MPMKAVLNAPLRTPTRGSGAYDNLSQKSPPEQVRRFADVARVSTATLWKTMLETVEATREAWRSHDPLDLLPTKIRNDIGSHLTTFARNIAGHKRTYTLQLQDDDAFSTSKFIP
jgi:hypothetical protein